MASFNDDDEMTSSDSLTERFLKHEDSSIDLEDSYGISTRKSSKKGILKTLWQYRASLFIHLVIFAVYTITLLVLFDHTNRLAHHGPDIVNSPAQSAVHFQKQFINNDVNLSSPFKGKPRPELDEAWEGLFTYNNIRVTKEELDKMNLTSVQLNDGSGDYLAALDVYHHLHCLKLIRQYIHPEYYVMQESLMVDTAEHIDHCLDAIRQELQCRSEVSLTTYEWLPDLPIPWAKLSYEHTCVDFDSINNWAKSRTVDIFDPKYLSHPTKGPPFGNGNNTTGGHSHGHGRARSL